MPSWGLVGSGSVAAHRWPDVLQTCVSNAGNGLDQALTGIVMLGSKKAGQGHCECISLVLAQCMD